MHFNVKIAPLIRAGVEQCLEYAPRIKRRATGNTWSKYAFGDGRLNKCSSRRPRKLLCAYVQTR